ncbi:MAG: PIN domain-containing protein [Chloroflexota bacterium]|nr:PIN domain-containing protein [Chloroflexota bacterium]
MSGAPTLPRAVLDTNVLYSHTRRTTLVGLVRLGRFEAIWSSWIVAELNRVLTWHWAARYGSDVTTQRMASVAAKEMMTYLLASFTLVDPPLPHPIPWPELTDVWDVPVYATAIAARAMYVVTDDRRHSPPRDPATKRRIWNGIEYITYNHFVALVM